MSNAHLVPEIAEKSCKFADARMLAGVFATQALLGGRWAPASDPPGDLACRRPAGKTASARRRGRADGTRQPRLDRRCRSHPIPMLNRITCGSRATLRMLGARRSQLWT